MKVTCKTAEQEFQPVTISITCESPEELFALWHRFNVSHIYVNEHEQSNEKYYSIPNGEIDYITIWKVIDNRVRNY